MDVWYGDGPLGICGDEDGGAMSSWYVLSAMGFYPVCPGQPAYEIGSPLFAETRITLDKGKVFTIIARGVSAQNKYIQSATLNGKPWDKAWFAHSDLAGGGTLVLEMGPKPNTAWGSAPDAAPAFHDALINWTLVTRLDHALFLQAFSASRVRPRGFRSPRRLTGCHAVGE